MKITRDSITGRFVKAAQALLRPETTTTEDNAKVRALQAENRAYVDVLTEVVAAIGEWDLADEKTADLAIARLRKARVDALQALEGKPA